MELKKLLITTGVITASFVAVFAAFSNESTIDFTNAASTQKEFVYDSSVSSQVEYGGSYTNAVKNVTTGISTPIATKLYRESGENKYESASLNNGDCFFYVQHSNQRAHAFEAGLNNLVGFEIKFKYSYDQQYDNGTYSAFNYNLTLTFYHGNTVVDTANYSLDKTTRGTEYTHTWSKDAGISEKIDYVKCSLDNTGGSSKDDWRELRIYYYKVIWNC